MHQQHGDGMLWLAGVVINWSVILAPPSITRCPDDGEVGALDLCEPFRVSDERLGLSHFHGELDDEVCCAGLHGELCGVQVSSSLWSVALSAKMMPTPIGPITLIGTDTGAAACALAESFFSLARG